MPVLNEHIPMATCSKDNGPCDIRTKDDCIASDTCSWMQFDDAHDGEEGVCVTDWEKCWRPSFWPPEKSQQVRAGPWSSKHLAKQHIVKKWVRQQKAAAAAEDPKPDGSCVSQCEKW
jgi:hypothetical protein